jgi:hypothetical protein
MAGGRADGMLPTGSPPSASPHRLHRSCLSRPPRPSSSSTSSTCQAATLPRTAPTSPTSSAAERSSRSRRWAPGSPRSSWAPARLCCWPTTSPERHPSWFTGSPTSTSRLPPWPLAAGHQRPSWRSPMGRAARLAPPAASGSPCTSAPGPRPPATCSAGGTSDHPDAAHGPPWRSGSRGAVGRGSQPPIRVSAERKAERQLTPRIAAAARLAISSGGTSSMWVATLHRCPKGSSNWPARSP